MLISYSRPTDIAWSLIGTDAAWLSDDAGAALIDDRPASVSRIQWISGTQTTGSELILRGMWGTALVPRVIGLMGVTLPAGTMIKLSLRRPTDAGYDYLDGVPQQRVVALPDGSRCVWFVLDAGLDPVIGAAFHLVNDVNGPASIAAGAAIDIGEAWIGPAVDIPHQRDWSRGSKDPSLIRRSLGGQMFGATRRAWRTLSVRFAPTKMAEVAGGGLAAGEDWERIEATLRGTATCVAIPRWIATDTAHIQREAIFGRVTNHGDVQHLGGPWYDRPYAFEEIPAAAAEG